MKIKLISLFFKTACLVAVLFFNSVNVSAQNKFVKNGQFYFSWGYNTEWYAATDIHVQQPNIGNDLIFHDVKPHDNNGLDSVLYSDLTIPQYNIRLGYFFNEKQDWGIEICFDHAKFINTDKQAVHVTGTMSNRTVDTTMIADYWNLRYFLNNGANFGFINLVKKLSLIQTQNENVKLDGLIKAGIGFTYPHVENNILSRSNYAHFQFGGFDADLDLGLKLTLFKYFYLEFTNKVVYAYYTGLKIHEGEASHPVWAYMLVGNAGVNFKLFKAAEPVKPSN